jgi:transcriptional antiterminator
MKLLNLLLDLLSQMYLENIKKLIYLIDRQITGTPELASEKLEVSIRTFYNYIKMLKEELGVPLKYDEYKQSYIYDSKGKIIWKWIAGNDCYFDSAPFKNKRLNCLYLILIQSEIGRTGEPKVLANNLSVSQRSLHYYLELLKLEFGVPLFYENKEKTYKLKSHGSLVFRWQSLD